MGIKDSNIVEPVSDAQGIIQEESVPTQTPADETKNYEIIDTNITEPVIDEQSVIKEVTAEVLEEIPSKEDNEEEIIEANDENTYSTEVDAVHEEISKPIEETAEEDASAKTSDCIVASDEKEDVKVVESGNNQN